MVLGTAVVSDNGLAFISSAWPWILFRSMTLGIELPSRKLIIGTKRKMETPRGIALEKLFLTQPLPTSSPSTPCSGNTFSLTILSPPLRFRLQTKKKKKILRVHRLLSNMDPACFYPGNSCQNISLGVCISL